MTALTTVTSLLLGLVLASVLGTPVSGHRSRHRSGPRCPTPSGLVHGQTALEFGGIQLRYTCDPGYKALGTSVTLCAGDHWMDPPPVCVAGGCLGLSGLKHGTVDYTHARGVAKVTCDAGYTARGPDVLVCDGRQWNGTIPQCFGETSALEGEDMINAQYLGKKYPARTHEEWMDRSDYSCVRGSDTLPPPPGVNTFPAVRWAIIKGQPRLYTLYRCKWGFVHAGNAKHMYCKSGHWVGHLPKCVTAPVVVSDWQHLPRDDSRPGLGLSHGDWLHLADYTCLGRAGAPHKVQPPHVEHASVLVKHMVSRGVPHLYLEYTCEKGYKLQTDQKYMYCRNKAWAGSLPVCMRDSTSVTPEAGPCRVNNGGCAHVCVWASGVNQAKCACRAGFNLSADQKNCEDIDECAVHNGGCGQHTCLNILGSFRCQCIAGYIQARDGHSCVRVSRARERMRPANIFTRAGF